MLVADANVVRDRGLERPRAAMNAAAQLLLGQEREPPLDEVDPRRANGREVQMKPGPLGQPASDHGSFVRGVVVENEVDVEVTRYGRLHGVEEFAELEGSMPMVTLPNDFAALHLEGG